MCTDHIIFYNISKGIEKSQLSKIMVLSLPLQSSTSLHCTFQWRKQIWGRGQPPFHQFYFVLNNVLLFHKVRKSLEE